MKITANIITLNEEDNIEACINSLKSVVDEIIIVDSNSRDATVNIAKSLGAKVVFQEYLGDGFQKNVVIEHAQYDWILSIDADERLDEEMQESIRKIKNATIHPESYSFKRKSYIGKRWIKHCGWYPDKCIRLYNKNATKFKELKGHSSVNSKDVKLLEGNIIHYSYKNYYDLLYKANRFSTRGANMLFDEKKQVNSFSPILHFLSAFLKTYVIKRGFFDGLDGLTIALTTALTSYMKYAKLLELRRNNTKSKSLWEQ